MVKVLLRRILVAAGLAFLIALWCWLITALHAIWSFGIVEGYLDGGRIPLYPSIPVTYGELFISTFFAPFAAFVLAFVWAGMALRRFQTFGFFACWLTGFWAGAGEASFLFQIDYGTTWGPTEALRALFIHPVVTPLALAIGLAGTALLTRPLRSKT